MEDKIVYHIFWERFRQGDKNAFLDLYKELYHPLVNFGLRIYADADLVCDATTQVFLELWEKHATLKRVENVTAYLRTYLKRKILDTLRTKRKTEQALANAMESSDYIEISYEELIVQLQTDENIKRKLSNALEKLTPRQKQLIQLKFFDGYSYEQIAESTKQTLKTAYNTIYDALTILRKELK